MSLQDMLAGRLYTPQQVKDIQDGKKPLKNRLDGANSGKEMNMTIEKMVAIAAMADIRTKAAYAVQTWAETDDLDKGESLYDRLDALISAIADGGIDLDGDASTDDTDDVYQVAMQAASDYMSALGADDSDLETLFNSKDDDARDEAANRLLEFLMQALGDDEDAAEQAVKNFAFDVDSDGSVFDSANYKKEPAIRDGKKTMLKKRQGPKLKRTPKQKASLLKAQNKAHSSSANLHRQKSLAVGHKAGLY
jgi:hypothetical protein